MKRSSLAVLTLVIASSLPICAGPDKKTKDETITILCTRDNKSFKTTHQNTNLFGGCKDADTDNNEAYDCTLDVGRPFLKFMYKHVIPYKLANSCTLPTALVDFRNALGDKKEKCLMRWLHDLDKSQYGTTEEETEHTQKKIAFAAALAANLTEKFATNIRNRGKEYTDFYLFSSQNDELFNDFCTPEACKQKTAMLLPAALTEYTKCTINLSDIKLPSCYQTFRSTRFFPYHLRRTGQRLTEQEIHQLACSHKKHAARDLRGVEVRTNREAVKTCVVNYTMPYVDDDEVILESNVDKYTDPDVFPNLATCYVGQWALEEVRNKFAKRTVNIEPRKVSKRVCICPEPYHMTGLVKDDKQCCIIS